MVGRCVSQLRTQSEYCCARTCRPSPALNLIWSFHTHHKPIIKPPWTVWCVQPAPEGTPLRNGLPRPTPSHTPIPTGKYSLARALAVPTPDWNCFRVWDSGFGVRGWLSDVRCQVSGVRVLMFGFWVWEHLSFQPRIEPALGFSQEPQNHHQHTNTPIPTGK